jgi:hypothetical protein
MNPGDEITRPIGLTLLALLNFVVGGLFGWIGLLALIQILHGVEASGLYWASALGGGVLAVGGIVSGVGYLRLRPFSGKTIGTVFGLLCLGYVAFGLANGKPINIFYIVMALTGVANSSLVQTLYKNEFRD